MFTLKCIIDLYLSSGRRLFCAFVDYQKAFDTVNRTALWKKLLSYNISGKIFRAITNLYKATKSCISHKGKMSSFFYSNVGVRQGENLPCCLLFFKIIWKIFSDNAMEVLP